MPNDSLAILDLLAQSDRPLQMKEIRARLAIARSSAFRLVEELLAEGWLTAAGSPRRYSASWKTAGLGLGMVQNHARRGQLFPLLAGLAQESGQQSGLAFYEYGKVYITDLVEVIGGRVLLSHGSSGNQALSTSAGRAILAHRPEEAEAVLTCGVVRLTEATKTEKDELRAELSRARELGYGTAIGEVQLGMMGVSSAILDEDGEPVAAFGLYGPERTHRARIEWSAMVLSKWVRQASALVGGRTEALVS